MSGFRPTRDRGREETGREFRYNVGSDTNSTNPALLNARVFVGNVHNENTGREDIQDRFSRYGKTLGISLHRGFSFIQYANEDDAKEAVLKEHGTVLKGSKIDVNLAKERRRDGERGTPGNPPPRPSRRSPVLDDDLPKESRWSFRPATAQREVIRDRSPIRIENPYVDNYGDNSDDKFVPRAGGSVVEPMYREDMREQFSFRKGNEEPGNFGRRPQDLNIPRADPGGTFDRSEPYKIDFGVGRSRSNSGEVRGDGGAGVGQDTGSKPNDCEIIALTKNQRSYAELVERKLRGLGLKVDLLFPHEGCHVNKILENISKSGCLYAIVVSPQNALHNSLTLNILHGTPQVHRNMPLDDAMVLLNRDFDTYNTRKAQPRMASAVQPSPQQHAAPQKQEAQMSSEYYNPAQPLQQAAQLPQTSNLKIQPLLSLLAGNQPLSTVEIDTVIEYLQKRKAQLLGNSSAAGYMPEDIYNKPAPETKSGELPPHILEIISPGSTSLQAQPPKDTANQLSSLAKANNAQTFINFSNPSVQKALDSLMQGGSANILRTLEAVSGGPAAAEPTGSNGGVNRTNQQRGLATHRHPLLGVPATRNRTFFNNRM